MLCGHKCETYVANIHKNCSNYMRNMWLLVNKMKCTPMKCVSHETWARFVRDLGEFRTVDQRNLIKMSVSNLLTSDAWKVGLDNVCDTIFVWNAAKFLIKSTTQMEDFFLRDEILMLVPNNFKCNTNRKTAPFEMLLAFTFSRGYFQLYKQPNWTNARKSAFAPAQRKCRPKHFIRHP